MYFSWKCVKDCFRYVKSFPGEIPLINTSKLTAIYHSKSSLLKRIRNGKMEYYYITYNRVYVDWEQYILIIYKTWSHQHIYFILRKNEMSRSILYFKSCTYSVHVQRPQILNAWPWALALAHGQEFNIWISLMKMGSIAFVFSIVNGIFATSLKTVRFSDKGWVGGRRVLFIL